MPTITHEFDWPDRVVVGTVGRPGSRTFFLQVRDGSRLVSAVLEKEQSAVLAEKIEEILDQLMVAGGNPFSVPAGTPAELVDNDPLQQPVDAQFRIGTMTLGWNPSTAQVVIEAYPYVETDDDELDPFEAEPDEPEEMLQVRIPVGTARAFAKRTREIVGAGRPLCPICGAPMDAGGHTCALPDDF
jgi:uncharacterized repeat protein (TIGR03847 family)